ncbi:hypothetical protein XELAEV_18003968mg [Xenopus laevis]|uniref:Uncharacterized protein n=1 Tax=Xenopus laevis TaxID=8355 RepID=A0A974GY28_XENLA|nr:hypothetical protein XELAEV_18003968mg [Xenopus laevis]
MINPVSVRRHCNCPAGKAPMNSPHTHKQRPPSLMLQSTRLNKFFTDTAHSWAFVHRKTPQGSREFHPQPPQKLYLKINT